MKGWSIGPLSLVGVLLAGSVGFLGPALPSQSAAPSQYAVVVYGDSFTRAWEPAVGDQPERSWATGVDPLVRSVVTRFRADAVDAVGTNQARSGAATEDLAQQVLSGPAGADLVLVLIGINDACAGLDPALVQVRARSGFASITQAHPRARVLVFAVPDLVLLGDLHANDPAAQAVRTFLKWCPPYMSQPRDAGALQEGGERLLAINQVLESEAAAHGFRFSWDTFGALSRPEDLSTLDYLHPSRAGEARLAEAAWTSVSQAMSAREREAPRALLVP